MSKIQEVKNPDKKRYTPPKHLKREDPAPEPAEEPETHAVTIPPLPTQIEMVPWGSFGIILRLANPIMAGTYHLTWQQTQELYRAIDQRASEVLAENNVQPD